MKVLVIGSGGREHALCWKLSQSEQVSEVYCAPGNPGTAEVAENIAIATDDIPGLVRFAAEKSIDLTVVGPEYPLTLGIADAFEEAGLRVFGPTQAAAQLEGSKSFAKDVMIRAGVPTAKFETFDNKEKALSYLDTTGVPIVVKADGLAAGKGVYVCSEMKDAHEAVCTLLAESDSQVVIEQCLIGKEASFIAAVSGDVILPLASSHDYKRIHDGDEGPNTGGMGTVSPTPRLQANQEEEIVSRVLRPVIQELAKRGIDFCGFLYAGLMIDESGEYHVLEFNTRLGDPEAQVILRRMNFDLATFLLQLCDSSFDEDQKVSMVWDQDASVCLVLAASGYPEQPQKGDEIDGLAQASAIDGVEIFHAGTAVNEQGKLVTSGGRVLNITTLGRDISEARKRAYEAAEKVQISGIQFRKDIALD